MKGIFKMASKTIINGIDVSKCNIFRDDVFTDKQLNNVCSIGLWQRDYSGLEEFCKMSCDCKSNPNCHFKQLARAKKENEELRNKLNSNIERMNEQNEKLHNENKELKAQLEQQKKENEELKEKIKAYQEDRFCQGGCAIYQYDKIHKLTQTLEKIEEFCIVYSSNHDAYETVYKQILDIINKAKDGE